MGLGLGLTLTPYPPPPTVPPARLALDLDCLQILVATPVKKGRKTIEQFFFFVQLHSKSPTRRAKELRLV